MDVQIYHLSETDDEQIAWCLNENSETVCIRTPWIYSVLIEAVKVNNPVKAKIQGYSANIKLTENIFRKFLAERKTSFKFLGITSVVHEDLTDIYFYQGNFKKSYLRVHFSTKSGFLRLRNLFQNRNQEEHEAEEEDENHDGDDVKGKVLKGGGDDILEEEQEGKKHPNVFLVTEGVYARFRILESDIPAYWHWMLKHNIRTASTVKIPPDAQVVQVSSPLRYSKAIHEFRASSLKLSTREIVTHPIILSWDIESLSKIPTKFPSGCLLQDVVFFISLYIKPYNSGDSIGRKVGIYLIDKFETLGLTEPKLEDGTELIIVNTEEELLDAFWGLIREVKPQILMGYNSMGFDSNYLDHKMSLYHKKYPNLSLVRDEKCDNTTTLRQFTWSSSAYSHMEGKYYDAPGMLTLDLFVEFKRNESLKAYTLDAVSEYFLGEHKVDLKAREMFDIYLDYQAGNPNADKLRRIAEYGVQDSVLPTRLFEHRNQWVTYIQMSCIMGVGIMDLVTRGQTLRTKSNIYRMSRTLGFAINVPYDKPIFKGKFKGAYVCDMTVGLHDHVVVYDFASLYPSIIAAYNLDYSTFIHRRDWASIPESLCNTFIIELPDGTTREVRYIKKEIHKGIMPRVVEDFLKARADTRAELKRTKDPTLERVLDKKQWAIKISNNSVYGAVSSDFSESKTLTDICSSSLGLKWIGMTVTSIGQKLIKGCTDFLVQKYGATPIYGDTDSTFFKLPKSSVVGLNEEEFTAEKLWKKAEEIAEEFNLTLTHPLKIELEKIIKMGGLTPKRYIYRSYNPKGNLNEKIEYKGVVAKRRDSCIWQTKLFSKVSEGILNNLSKQEITKIIFQSIIDLMRGKVDTKKLLIGGSIAEVYKSTTCPMSRLKTRMAELGKPIAGGSRIEYVIVQFEISDPSDNSIRYVSPYQRGSHGGIKQLNKVADRMKMADEIIPGVTKIDFVYYAEKKAQTSVDQLFGAAFDGDVVIAPIIKNLKIKPEETLAEMEFLIANY